LVDGIDAEGAIARSAADAPEIDGVVQIAPHASLKQGELAVVRITGADAHDLQGVVNGKA
jgi:ribosomal protein S12 methylthiotransferase